MQCTALVHIPRPIRRYRCNDPECARYPKGHRHAATCNTTTPRGLMYGQALCATSAAAWSLGTTARQLAALGCPDAAAVATRLRAEARDLLSTVRSAGIPRVEPA